MNDLRSTLCSQGSTLQALYISRALYLLNETAVWFIHNILQECYVSMLFTSSIYLPAHVLWYWMFWGKTSTENKFNLGLTELVNQSNLVTWKYFF